MVPFAVAGAEYGALAGRGSLSRVTSDVLDALSSPDLETVAWVAAAVGVVLLATRRRGRLAFMLLLAGAAVFAVKILDLW
jgi:hypothetical protein